MSRRAFQPPSECPVCGEALPPRAHACPHCGADERSGWDENTTRYDGADLPESAFESKDANNPASRRRGPFFTPVTLGVIAALLALLLLLAALGAR